MLGTTPTIPSPTPSPRQPPSPSGHRYFQDRELSLEETIARLTQPSASYYQLLQCEPTATPQDLAKSYRSLPAPSTLGSTPSMRGTTP